jgi:hypothetical protein
MPELSANETSITGAHPGRRNAAAHEAHGVQTFAVTSAPAVTTIPVARIHYLARHQRVATRTPITSILGT